MNLPEILDVVAKGKASNQVRIDLKLRSIAMLNTEIEELKLKNEELNVTQLAALEEGRYYFEDIIFWLKANKYYPTERFTVRS